MVEPRVSYMYKMHRVLDLQDNMKQETQISRRELESGSNKGKKEELGEHLLELEGRESCSKREGKALALMF